MDASVIIVGKFKTAISGVDRICNKNLNDTNRWFTLFLWILEPKQQNKHFFTSTEILTKIYYKMGHKANLN